MTRGECALISYQGYVERKMMPTELNQPRRAHGRSSKKREVIFIATKNYLPTRPATLGQLLISLHDGDHLLIAGRAQCNRQQSHRGRALSRGEIAKTQADALKNSRRQVRPALPLNRVIKCEHRLGSSRLIQHRKEGLRCRNRRRTRLTCRCSRGGLGVESEVEGSLKEKAEQQHGHH